MAGAYRMEQVTEMVATEKMEAAEGPTFHCAICGGASPHGTQHACRLSPKQRAKIAQERAKARPEPTAGPTFTCNACGESMSWPIRPPHNCSKSQGAQLAASLRAAGYQLVPVKD